MSTSRQNLSGVAPIAWPADLTPSDAPSLAGSALRGYHALRRRWKCMSPRCNVRNLLPARIQVQQGWCCSPGCAQDTVQTLARELLHQQAAANPQHAHRVPLGLLLLSRGVIDHAQLRRALEAQAESGGRIGEWLIRQGAVEEDDVAAGVALQWSRPIFRLVASQSWRHCCGWVPAAILSHLRMVPLHYDARDRHLFVGFTQCIDFRAVAGLARVLECKVEPCIVADSAFDEVLEHMRVLPGGEQMHEVAFDHVDTDAEIAGIVRQYAQAAAAHQIRMALLGPFLWVRIRGSKLMHISFRQ